MYECVSREAWAPLPACMYVWVREACTWLRGCDSSRRLLRWCLVRRLCRCSLQHAMIVWWTLGDRSMVVVECRYYSGCSMRQVLIVVWWLLLLFDELRKVVDSWCVTAMVDWWVCFCCIVDVLYEALHCCCVIVMIVQGGVWGNASLILIDNWLSLDDCHYS